jgi:UDP-glucose/GDP-mannose dehydrogenase family, UDP binding domain
VKGAQILVLGLAYKKNTNDARETPADAVVRGLVELGAAVAVGVETVCLSTRRRDPRWPLRLRQLTWRAVCDHGPPPLPNWGLQLGDVELF